MSDVSPKKLTTKVLFIIAFSFFIFILYCSFSHLHILIKRLNKDDEMRGVWVATVLNLDYPASSTVSSPQLRRQADTILDNVLSYGFNTIFLQVCPCSDAFYPSEIYPWSTYLTGQQGLAPDSDFDPLAYWINGAHTRGIELHAWINPYRITINTEDWEYLADTSPARQHPEWVIKYNENYYFNPALPEVRQLILDSTEEILTNYNIDGIHLDDYFYPGSDFDDAVSFAVYGDGFTDIGDWRRNNVNQLVEALHDTVHRVKPNAEFGISPSGIWASNDLEPGGSSNPSTNSSYRNHYADSKLWVENEWVDYIAPQLYWEIGHESADFTTLLNWWTDLTEPFDVKLYIGLADYRTLEATSKDDPWYNGEEIVQQLIICHTPPRYPGRYIFAMAQLQIHPLCSEHYHERTLPIIFRHTIFHSGWSVFSDLYNILVVYFIHQFFETSF